MSTQMAAPTPFFYTFISGPIAYCFLLLVYGHEMLQMVIPSIEKDRHHYGKQVEFRRFPCFRDEGGSAPGSTVSMALSFHATEWVRDDCVVLDMQYQHKLRH